MQRNKIYEKEREWGKALFKEKMAQNIPESKKHITLKPMVKKEIIVDILKYLEQENRDTSYQDLWDRNFPGSPVVKMLCFEYRGPRFNPWLGN